VNARDVVVGIVQVAFGYLKKVLADNLTLYLDAYQDRLANLQLQQRWFLFSAIAFRILFDFSGYSDIAIGLARMMGIRLPPNFNWPYLATSIQTFWQRWHMSAQFGDTGLRLYPFRRQPLRARTSNPKWFNRFRAMPPLAWNRLEFCHLGPVPRRWPWRMCLLPQPAIWVRLGP
jgi:hypothetical protein